MSCFDDFWLNFEDIKAASKYTHPFIFFSWQPVINGIVFVLLLIKIIAGFQSSGTRRRNVEFVEV
jgi:hypothetical protein